MNKKKQNALVKLLCYLEEGKEQMDAGTAREVITKIVKLDAKLLMEVGETTIIKNLGLLVHEEYDRMMAAAAKKKKAKGRK